MGYFYFSVTFSPEANKVSITRINFSTKVLVYLTCRSYLENQFEITLNGFKKYLYNNLMAMEHD